MATLEALEAAAARGCNLVICHEQLHYPYDFQSPPLHDALTWRVNRMRFSALANHGLTVYRAHGQADRFSIVDDFGDLIGMPAPAVNQGLCRIYEIAPTTVGELAEQVKARMGLGHLRVSGDLAATVRRVGSAIGGLGLSLNVGFINALLDYGADVLVAGECDEYAFRYTEDAGVPMIETAHSVSENPGLATFARAIGAQFPGLPVVAHTVPCPWQTV